MDPADSFLNLLSPGFNDLDIAWDSPSDADFYSMQAAPPLSWLNDGFINMEGAEEDDDDEDDDEEEEDDEDEESEEAVRLKTPTSTTSALSTSIVSNASEYSSVLKLSDIASALRNFSTAAGSACEPHVAPLQKLSPAQSFSSAPHSPCLPDASMAKHSPVQNVCASKNDHRPNAFATQSRPLNAMSHSRDVSANAAFKRSRVSSKVTDMAPKVGSDVQCSERETSIKPSSGPVATNEKELSSKLNCDVVNEWDSSENENDDDEDEYDDDFADYEDVKPCVSHVKIIRRRNSNCGQGLAPSPKRAKFSHVKAEATSSSELASLQDDKDGASSLKLMRKEGMSQREVHILSERQRRKSMRESFSILQSLIPKLKLKHTDRITVLTEVITYIQSLRVTLEELERKKADIMEFLGLSAKTKARRQRDNMQGTITYINSNNSGSSDEKGERAGGGCNSKNGEMVATVEVTVRMCGADVFITLNTTHRRGVWSRVLSLLQKFSIEVSNATLTTCGDSSFHCIHAKATNVASVEGVNLQEELEGVIVKELRRRSRKGSFSL